MGGGGVEEAMSGEEAPPPCDFCAGTPAVVYCRADSARLCLPCDRLVHGANTVSTRHARAPLCAACSAAAAAATFRRRRDGSEGFLCGNCDFEEREQHPDGGSDLEPPLHDRRAVEGYTGCPSIGDLAVILGVDGGYEKAAGDGLRPAWKEEEEPHKVLLRLEDVIVPTTSCHGLQPLVTPASPKDRSAAVGKLSEEVIRQLGDLAKSEAAAAVEPADDDGVQLPSWVSSDCTGFEAFNPEACQEAASMTVPPSCEHEEEAWIATDCTRASSDDAWRTTFVGAHGSALAPAASSSAEPCLLSALVDISQICPSMSSNNKVDVDDDNVDIKRDPATAAATPQEPAPAPAKKQQGGYNVAYPDRGTVISRYKEKRKNRRFGKQIRYESRKARAEGRLRIKGRFAKAN